MQMNNTITVAYGDGIGPEIMDSVLEVLSKAKTGITVETVEVGEKVYHKNFSSGITPESWEVIKKNRILLKAPITTPLGHGYKSLNVTLRRGLDLFANIRPSISYYPYIGNRENIDVVIIRENQEDLYAGIDYSITKKSHLSLKFITDQGSEKIIRYAFEYALANGRKKVTCITKSNIMKITDGNFQKIFESIAKEYPELQADHMLVDIASAKLANRPEMFDVIVTLNLYGDILSDIASETSGSVGLSGSANIGKEFAMFEAVHGSAPDIAGKDIANPSGLLNSAIMMLRHMDKSKQADLIQNALFKTIEDGLHTPDIYSSEKSSKKLGTKDFTKAIIDNFGHVPQTIKISSSKNSTSYSALNKTTQKITEVAHEELIGVDVYIGEQYNTELLKKILSISHSVLQLHLISIRGLMIWPHQISNINSDFIRCRFLQSDTTTSITQSDIISLLSDLNKLNLSIRMMINLRKYDNKIGFSLAQGE